jgi:hypothetical protein
MVLCVTDRTPAAVADSPPDVDPGPAPAGAGNSSGARRPGFARVSVPADWKPVLAVYAWVQLVLLGWWAAEFPGYLSYDSTVYVTHVTTGPWSSEHSVLYDFLVKVSIHLCDTVWLLTLGQTIVWPLVLVYFMRSLQIWGVSLKWAAIPVVLVPLVPSFGTVVPMVWKDVPFALVEVLLTGTLLRLLATWPTPPARRLRRPFGHDREAATDGDASFGERRIPWHQLLFVFLEVLALLLFRNDAFLMIGPLAVITLIAFRGLRLRLLAVTVAALAVWLFVSAVVYPAAGIKGAKSSLSYGTFYADIAVVYRWAPGTFSAADKAVMRKVAPLSSWRTGGADCFNGDLLRKSPHYSATAADKYRTRLAKIWFHTMEKTPVATVKSRLCRGAIAWNPVPVPWPRANVNTLAPYQTTDYFGRADLLTKKMRRELAPRPIIGALEQAARWDRTHFDGKVWQVFFWRGATWCYLAFIALIVAAARRRSWRLFLAGASVCVANQLMVMAANPAQLFRYMVGPLFVGMLLIPVLAVPRRTSPPDPAPADGQPTEVADPVRQTAPVDR